MFSKEPILRSLLCARQLAIEVELKKKAKILVNDSALLMGVIDESGILEKGEVFV